MQFYQFAGLIADEKYIEENQDRRTRNEHCLKISRAAKQFNEKLGGRAFFFVSDASDDLVMAGILCREPIDVEKKMKAFLRAVGIDSNETDLEETTLEEFLGLVSDAEHSGCIKDADEVLRKFGLEPLASRFGKNLDYGENLIDRCEKAELIRKSTRYLAGDVFLSELDRIYAGKRVKTIGHPVHYFLQTDDRDTRRELYRILLTALYENGRIRNRRYSYIDFRPGKNFSRKAFDCLYRTCEGGAVVVRFDPKGDEGEDDCASGTRELIETICETMRKYRNRVLTVFCLPRECTRTKEMFLDNLGDTGMIELREEFVSGERACGFLKLIAKENAVRTDKKLFAQVKEGELYLANDLRDLFDEWFNTKLKTTIYPEYRQVVSAKKTAVRTEERGSAYDELKEMIGLGSAKRVIDQALDFYKAQRVFADKGIRTARPAMHMCFTGSPGTAKTSVARLFARVMKENGILSKGTFIECGRGDLVGKYVGWTAPAVQKKFKDASGGVLFIDEAYSLVDDRSGSYGDEAINTIVQEMENHRDDVVVIFAGYSDKMEGFLEKNPGLRSRIAFHVPFDDYNAEELTSIARLIAKKKQFTLTDEACEKLHGVFEEARKDTDFGNGRYARNVVEKAILAQASRILKFPDPDAVTKKELTTIAADDIETPERATAGTVRQPIGFCA